MASRSTASAPPPSVQRDVPSLTTTLVRACACATCPRAAPATPLATTVHTALVLGLRELHALRPLHRRRPYRESCLTLATPTTTGYNRTLRAGTWTWTTPSRSSPTAPPPPYWELCLTLATPTALWLRYLRHHWLQPYSPLVLGPGQLHLPRHSTAAAVQRAEPHLGYSHLYYTPRRWHLVLDTRTTIGYNRTLCAGTWSWTTSRSTATAPPPAVQRDEPHLGCSLWLQPYTPRWHLDFDTFTLFAHCTAAAVLRVEPRLGYSHLYYSPRRWYFALDNLTLHGNRTAAAVQ